MADGEKSSSYYFPVLPESILTILTAPARRAAKSGSSDTLMIMKKPEGVSATAAIPKEAMGLPRLPGCWTAHKTKHDAF